MKLRPFAVFPLLCVPALALACPVTVTSARAISYTTPVVGANSVTLGVWVYTEDDTGDDASSLRQVTVTEAEAVTIAKASITRPDAFGQALRDALNYDYGVEDFETLPDEDLATAVGTCWRGGTGYASGSFTVEACNAHIAATWGSDTFNPGVGEAVWAKADWTNGLPALCNASSCAGTGPYGYVRELHRVTTFQMRGWWGIPLTSEIKPAEEAEIGGELTDAEIWDWLQGLNAVGWQSLLSTVSGRPRPDVVSDAIDEATQAHEDCTTGDETIINPTTPPPEATPYGSGATTSTGGSGSSVAPAPIRGNPGGTVTVLGSAGAGAPGGQFPAPGEGGGGVDCAETPNILACAEVPIYTTLLSDLTAAGDALESAYQSASDGIEDFSDQGLLYQAGDYLGFGPPAGACPFAGGILISFMGNDSTIDTDTYCEIAGGPVRTMILLIAWIGATVIIIRGVVA